MKCLDCGNATKTHREPQRGYGGLSGLTLLNAEVERCPNCGAYGYSYERIEDLDKTIALFLAQKPGPLAPDEIRFLRKYLGLSTGDMAVRMGVTRETVSRWERQHESFPMGPTAERLLRVMATRELPVSEYPLEKLDAIEGGKPESASFRVKNAKGHWRAEAA